MTRNTDANASRTESARRYPSFRCQKDRQRTRPVPFRQLFFGGGQGEELFDLSEIRRQEGDRLPGLTVFHTEQVMNGFRISRVDAQGVKRFGRIGDDIYWTFQRT